VYPRRLWERNEQVLLDLLGMLLKGLLGKKVLPQGRGLRKVSTILNSGSIGIGGTSFILDKVRILKFNSSCGDRFAKEEEGKKGSEKHPGCRGKKVNFCRERKKKKARLRALVSLILEKFRTSFVEKRRLGIESASAVYYKKGETLPACSRGPRQR